MLRNEPQLKNDLGEPESRYYVDTGDGDPEVWRWHCTCLAVRISSEGFHWSPCETHRPTDWGGWSGS
jgi:hypothetical protein